MHFSGRGWYIHVSPFELKLPPLSSAEDTNAAIATLSSPSSFVPFLSWIMVISVQTHIKDLLAHFLTGYHSTALLPSIAKLLEGVLCTPCHEVFSSYFINSLQYGSLPHFSSEPALVKVTYDTPWKVKGQFWTLHPTHHWSVSSSCLL